ncbi:MAG: multidrug transporter [Candidatus Pelagibacterales bacterium]|nr:MAG: multidrug transporter [Pelagibacterales bacterium]
MTLRDTLIAAIVPIFLGFGFVIAKPAMEYLPPFLLMGLRFTFVALLLVWWFPIPRGFLKKIFFASLIANTTQYSITYTGLSFIDASAAVLLVQTEVPFGVVFAYFMLKEKPTIRSLVGIAIAFVGVYILTGSPNLDGKFIGVSLVILGSGIWALGQVLVKPLSKKINPLALVAWLGLFSGPILITLSAIFDGNPINYFKTTPFEIWMIAIYLGFIMQPITYGCFYYVLKNNPLYKVLPIVTMGIPPTGLLAAIFLLGEEPTKELFIGGAIIIVGVILIVFNKPKKTNPKVQTVSSQ